MAADRRRENRLLFAASAISPSGVGLSPPRLLQAEACATDAVAGLDWHYVLRAADQQGVAPLLCRWLDEHGGIAAPQDIRAALQSARWVTHFHNRILRDALVELLRAAADAGMSVMPLKGAALTWAYYETSGLRPMSDLDLLVRPGDAEACGAMLRGLGYTALERPAALLAARLRDPAQREHAYVAERAGTTVMVEYRTEPLDPMGAPLDPTLSARLLRHAARMWERGTPGTFDGAPFVRIAPEDLLLHITSHLSTRHVGLRLLWLHDAGRVLAARQTDFDWPSFFRAVETLHLTAPVMAALDAAYRWLGAPSPEAVPMQHRFTVTHAIERWGSARQVATLDRTDLTDDREIGTWEAASAWLRMRGVRPRLRALRGALFPGRAYLDAWRLERGLGDAGYAVTLARRAALHLRALLRQTIHRERVDG